jgi:hypothetical protein
MHTWQHHARQNWRADQPKEINYIRPELKAIKCQFYRERGSSTDRFTGIQFFDELAVVGNE